MIAKNITYRKSFSNSNNEVVTIGIELDVQDGEKAVDVYNAAKKFVENKIAVEKKAYNNVISQNSNKRQIL